MALLLEEVYEVSRRMWEIQSLNGVLDRTLSIARDWLGCPTCSILLLAHKESSLFLVARMEGGVCRILPDRPAVKMEGALARTLNTGQSEQVFRQAKDFSSAPVLATTQAFWAVPIVGSGSSCGLLVAESESPGGFSDIEKRAFWVLGREAGPALFNAVYTEQLGGMAQSVQEE